MVFIDNQNSVTAEKGALGLIGNLVHCGRLPKNAIYTARIKVGKVDRVRCGNIPRRKWLERWRSRECFERVLFRVSGFV